MCAGFREGYWFALPRQLQIPSLPACTSSYVTDVRLYALNGVVPVKIQYHNKEDTHKENEKKKLQPFFTINKLDPWTHASLGRHQACTSAAPGSRKASLTLKELY